jgi:hypothetical protein
MYKQGPFKISNIDQKNLNFLFKPFYHHFTQQSPQQAQIDCKIFSRDLPEWLYLPAYSAVLNLPHMSTKSAKL